MCFSPYLPLPLDDPFDLNLGPANLLESEVSLFHVVEGMLTRVS